MMASLRGEEIKTWFDLGIYLDRLRDMDSRAGFTGSYEDYIDNLKKGGIGFVTFYYTIDGITIELEKYHKVLEQLLPEVPLYFIGGELGSEAWNSSAPERFKQIYPEMKSFNGWNLYNDFFNTRLERGSETYNRFITSFWNETLKTAEILANSIEKNNINLLFLINVCSNPGNVSLALACVLVSEYLGIPVINNCHDFYWEGGNSPADIKYKKLAKGPRDFFFTNAHLGEVFSIIELLFPWDSRSWFTLVINRIQKNQVIEDKGHNPANVDLMGTALDISHFEPVSKQEIIRTLYQVGGIFKRRTKAIDVILSSVEKKKPGPFLVAKKAIHGFNFERNNIVLLQPSRIISRKCIELNFRLLNKLFKQSNFSRKFVNNQDLKITILITGPIPQGQWEYFQYLLKEFSNLLGKIPGDFQNRVFLGFLFSEIDKEQFKKKHNNPITIEDIYNASSLILLPSETEGRGLPIIEAAAAGKPVFCRRYEPQEVYSEVIGEHLHESQRLRVLEFSGDRISRKLANSVTDKIFYPQDSLVDVTHNQMVIKKRFRLANIQRKMERVLNRLYLQISSIPDRDKRVKFYLKEYGKYFNSDSEHLAAILNQKTRHYLPGYGRLGFMIFLKSLIDPSFFRVEEQQIKGLVMEYSQRLFRSNPNRESVSTENYHNVFNIVDDIFYYNEKEITVRHDHSLAYRHRNKKKYPYRSYTYHELTGLINLIYRGIINPSERSVKVFSSHAFFSDWNLALVQLTNSHYLSIDDREILFRKLKQRIPRAYFPGRYIKYELEFFVLQPVRVTLNLRIEEELTERILKKNIDSLPKIYVFIHENHVMKRYSSEYVTDYLKYTKDKELKILFKHGIVEIVKTRQICIGFHLLQMGDSALQILRNIKEQNGFIITNGENAAMMTDILDIDHFHIGRASGLLSSRIMGIPVGSGFVQFVPAGVRATLAYPTPNQTARDFSNTLKSKQFKKLSKKLGEQKIFELLRHDAEERGSPINLFLNDLEKSTKSKRKGEGITNSYIGGIYRDGQPWNGVMARIENQPENLWKFAAHIASDSPKSVPDLIQEFEKKNKINTRLAWNGGYILNPELVGKLGLPETYIGSPLGLLIANRKVVSPPLFDKPAFLISKDGSTDIRRVNCSGGFTVSYNKHSLEFKDDFYNKHSSNQPCYYDLLHKDPVIPANGNVLIRLAGVVIKEIIYTVKDEQVEIIPVGLTLSVPSDQFSKKLFQIEREIRIKLSSPTGNSIKWETIENAIEAGPTLIEAGKVAIDMEKEGWKTGFSISTQAARLDFTDMRGPKIAVGITGLGELIVLMINGRIRESVGATHRDMAEIMLSYGTEKAIGFDPGGSSTLVVDGKVLNISPYNSAYEKNVYSLPPEPRFVSSAIIGWNNPGGRR